MGDDEDAQGVAGSAGTDATRAHDAGRAPTGHVLVRSLAILIPLLAFATPLSSLLLLTLPSFVHFSCCNSVEDTLVHLHPILPPANRENQ